MILLKAATETLQLTSSSTANIDFSVSFIDITSTSLSPSSNEGTVAAIGSVSLLSAPATSTQRQVKLITLSNRHATVASKVVIQKLISATTYSIMPSVTLLAGEMVQYMDGQGWLYYSSTGAVKTSQTAPGTTGQVLFNNASTLSASSGLTWTNATGALALTGTNAQIQLSAVTAVPNIPAAGILEVYSQLLAGKMQLMKQGPSGDNEAVQASLWQNNTVIWTPGGVSNAGNWQGSAAAVPGGTVAAGVQATTSPYAVMRRSTFTSVVTTTDQSVGLTSDQMFWRGGSAGLGGFFFSCRFGLNTWTSGDRLFVGFQATTSGSLLDATTVANTAGFAINSSDSAITFVHVDGTTTNTKDIFVGQPTLASGNGYDAYIYARPNDSTIYYRLENSLTGTVIIDSSTTSTLPSNTTFLYAKVLMSNGANTSVGAASLGVNRLYIETNR